MGGGVSGAAAIAAYYCNSYPLTTSSPGLVTAVAASDRNNPMLLSGTYSEFIICLFFFFGLLLNIFICLVDPRSMHLSGSPLLRETKSESCSSPSDESGVINNSNSGGFSVIFRPGDTPTSDHDSLPSHRYTTHTTSRLAGVHSRPDEGISGFK